MSLRSSGLRLLACYEETEKWGKIIKSRGSSLSDRRISISPVSELPVVTRTASEDTSVSGPKYRIPACCRKAGSPWGQQGFLHLGGFSRIAAEGPQADLPYASNPTRCEHTPTRCGQLKHGDATCSPSPSLLWLSSLASLRVLVPHRETKVQRVIIRC